MRIAICCDQDSIDQKESLMSLLKKDHQFVDSEISNDPITVVQSVLDVLLNGKAVVGIIISSCAPVHAIFANKYKGIRCALCTSKQAAEMSRQQIDPKVLCLDSSTNSSSQIGQIVKKFLETPFESGKHQIKKDQITQIENLTAEEMFEEVSEEEEEDDLPIFTKSPEPVKPAEPVFVLKPALLIDSNTQTDYTNEEPEALFDASGKPITLNHTSDYRPSISVPLQISNPNKDENNSEPEFSLERNSTGDIKTLQREIKPSLDLRSSLAEPERTSQPVFVPESLSAIKPNVGPSKAAPIVVPVVKQAAVPVNPVNIKPMQSGQSIQTKGGLGSYLQQKQAEKQAENMIQAQQAQILAMQKMQADMKDMKKGVQAPTLKFVKEKPGRDALASYCEKIVEFADDDFSLLLNEIKNVKEEITAEQMHKIYTRHSKLDVPVNTFKEADCQLMIKYFFTQAMRRDLAQLMRYDPEIYITLDEIIGIMVNEDENLKAATEKQYGTVNNFYQLIPKVMDIYKGNTNE
ncbi:Ribose_5-phosphate isomerase [Hexamita inflata]|uniref:Ribose_5-phosphate isomerase n=1 Tax=Hexamita inflata TaxID=28002 RepID=A0ABP1HH36_9EUKA